MDFAKFKAILQRANDCLERWLSLKDAGSKLLANADNILQRLPVLSERRNFAAMPAADQLQKLVLSKQLRALEAVFGRLQANLAELEALLRTQERLVVEVWRLLGEAPSAAACGAVQSGGVSVAQVVECVEDVWRLCSDDLAVRAATLAGLTHTTSPQQFSELQGALQASSGLLPDCLPVLLMQSAAAAMR